MKDFHFADGAGVEHLADMAQFQQAIAYLKEKLCPRSRSSWPFVRQRINHLLGLSGGHSV